MSERTITVNALARVEGEGALHVRLRGDDVEIVEFRIFEPPRFFEGLLQGREATEAPDITSRICGICPVAYITSACQAVEQAWGTDIPPEIAALRRLIYCGEWIQSHVLHAAMLHAPDYLGLRDIIEISEVEPELVTTALRLKKLGNDIMEVIGGRAVHPVNTRVGGFFRAPDRAAISALLPELEWGIGAARTLALRFAEFDFPDDRGDYTFVAMVHPQVYPIEAGRIGSSRGLDIPVSDFHDHFTEEQVVRSTALHGRMRDGAAYLVGPLARYALNRDHLGPTVLKTAQDCGVAEVECNPFRSILVRMLEVQYACEEALRLAGAYVPPDPPAAEVHPRAGIGQGCTEAPRGICHHRYRIDAKGRIVSATIVPPTSQNQPQIEADLKRVIRASRGLDDTALRLRCEQVIRNHDPCISCATHFLDLSVDRG
ncbi:coenzyme F420-reducing hydrogenase alpha subunit [Aliiruegeria haliotis]|uniref:Coenzyme F420-reducing hydrogenase alpha subunit n=1 Tax=Aliiruegeria haliotis TaxID=1280846 RepID=A0A2T0S0C8_9RHOB|nr:nickel-dependent hydrogenase large subunit [Aliiruegeria haliotis]PRY26886.1 coenzyme F420-reducing hydrogenase alpha subunit [Aliiruegeria haliotis]